RVDVGGVRAVRKVGARTPRLVHELLEDEVRALGPLDLEDGVEGIDPLPCLERIDVLKAVHVGASLKTQSYNDWQPDRKGPAEKDFCRASRSSGWRSGQPPEARISEEIQSFRCGSRIVSEKSILSYYKSVFLRAFRRGRGCDERGGAEARLMRPKRAHRPTTTGNGMTEQAHGTGEGG